MEAFIQSHWFPDTIVLVVLLLFAIVNGKKGLFKCIIPVIILVASIVGASILTPLAEPVVSNALQPWVEENITQKLENIDLSSLESLLSTNGVSDLLNNSDTTDEAQNEAVSETISGMLPENISEYLQSYGISVSDVLKNLKLPDISVSTDKIKEQAKAIFESFVATSAAKIIHTVLYVVIVLLLYIVLNIVKSVLNPIIEKLPIVGSVNSIGGAVLGLIEGIILVWLVVVVIKTFNIMEIDKLAQGTYLLKYFVNFEVKTLFSLI